MSKVIPKWLRDKLGLTSRQWKAQKRQELKNIISAVSIYENGCAYAPNYDEVRELRKILKEMKKAHSVKEWG